MNKLVALNFISVFLFSLGYRSNRVIALGVSSVFLFALGVCFVGSWRRPGAVLDTLVEPNATSSEGCPAEAAPEDAVVVRLLRVVVSVVRLLRVVVSTGTST